MESWQDRGGGGWGRELDSLVQSSFPDRRGVNAYSEAQSRLSREAAEGSWKGGREREREMRVYPG